MMHPYRSLPPRQGLYDPTHEHDSCGTGFVVNIKGEKSHDILEKGLEVLRNLEHRGACGCDPLTGDGAGLLMQIPHEFLRKEAEWADAELAAVLDVAPELVSRWEDGIDRPDGSVGRLGPADSKLDPAAALCPARRHSGRRRARPRNHHRRRKREQPLRRQAQPRGVTGYLPSLAVSMTRTPAGGDQRKVASGTPLLTSPHSLPNWRGRQKASPTRHLPRLPALPLPLSLLDRRRPEIPVRGTSEAS